jgi:hypothetical protein
MSCQEDLGLNLDGWVCEKLGTAVEAAVRLPESREKRHIVMRLALVISMHERWDRRSHDQSELEAIAKGGQRALELWRERWDETMACPVNEVKVSSFSGDSFADILNQIESAPPDDPPQLVLNADGSVTASGPRESSSTQAT